ncbi:hypothetical protein [Streptomyces purpurogeneiscleroticus]|uniref:hypothetical protein n=1 Tax=Streptomyces purpurogeneiscleroticus TaxID=68259 RepID=UPI001CC14686|nr:hypothetical protein [Streptomyces purpurogeneiscleroticus]MBZ4014922.1 hypothetical protein [Streptomyces purpurogeneiscleroticus]
MRRAGSVFALVAGALLASVSATAPATAAPSNGEVTVFQTEIQPVTTYENPVGCNKLPLGSHVLVNRTDKPVKVYGDPFCLTPSLTVQPGHGAHVDPTSGSFSA